MTDVAREEPVHDIVLIGVPRFVVASRLTSAITAELQAREVVSTQCPKFIAITQPQRSVVERGQMGTPGDGGAAATFENAAATTITVGGISAGSTFPTPHTLQEMFDELLYPYQVPAFTAFGISGVSSPLEVGASFGAGVTFTWSTSHSANVATNSIEIDDVTGAAILGTGLANSGSYVHALGAAVTRTTAGNHQFAIGGADTHSDSIDAALTIDWLWRRYFGAASSSSLTAGQILGLAGSGLAVGYAGNFAMASGGYKYICFADAAGGQINTVKDATTLLNVPLAAGTLTDGGGFGYELVSVTNAQGITTDVRTYRSLNTLGAAITLQVT